MQFNKEQITQFLKYQYKNGDLIVKLIFVNLGFYLVFSLIRILQFLFRLPSKPISSFIENYFSLPNQANELWIKWYTLLTYQFVHFDLLHVFFNMLLLYFFCKMLLPYLGIKRIFPLYILGGFFGAIVFVLFSIFKVIPIINAPMVGASASVMALMGAATVYLPNYILKFFLIFDVKLKWMTLAFAGLNLLNLLSPEGAGTGLIHLAGLGFGALFVYFYKNGVDYSKPFNKLVDQIVVLFRKKPKMKVTFVNEENKSSKKSTNVDQKKVDAILDKISQEGGYNNLTKEEKDYLFKASKN